MEKRSLLALVGVCAIVMFAVMACGQPVPEPPPPTAAPRISPPPPPPAPTVAVAATNGASGEDAGGGTPVTVALQDIGGSGAYAFSPADLTFNAGDKITFTLTSETEYHSFTVDELEINVDVEAEETQTYTFTFDKPGTYELICIPHTTQEMVGTITVN